MKEEVKTLIKISSFVAIFVFVLLLCLKIDILDSVSYAITGGLAFSVLFNCWIWKLPVLHPLLIWTPNLNGKWDCIIETTYEGKKKKINATATIKQTFASIYVLMETKESKSTSKNGLLERDKGTGQVILSYVYENIPGVQIRERSQIHFGAVRLEVKNKNTVEGEYWTDRKSIGTLALTRNLR